MPAPNSDEYAALTGIAVTAVLVAANAALWIWGQEAYAKIVFYIGCGALGWFSAWVGIQVKKALEK